MTRFDSNFIACSSFFFLEKKEILSQDQHAGSTWWHVIRYFLTIRDKIFENSRYGKNLFSNPIFALLPRTERSKNNFNIHSFLFILLGICPTEKFPFRQMLKRKDRSTKGPPITKEKTSRVYATRYNQKRDPVAGVSHAISRRTPARPRNWFLFFNGAR